MARKVASIARPIGPAAWNQTAMTLISPKARTPSAAPSLRCSGGRSRAVAALRPAARAVPPTSVAKAFQMAATARASARNGSSSGERRPADRADRRDRVLLGRDVRAGGRVRVLVLTRQR
jgi:hypothetical protein